MEEKTKLIRGRLWAIDRETVVDDYRVEKVKDVKTEMWDLLDGGDYEKVIADLTPADEPLRDPKALTMRAVAQMGLSRHEDALADLEAAEPRVWTYLGVVDVNRAHVHKRQGRPDEAREAAERAMERMPSAGSVVCVSLASAFDLDGDDEAAGLALREMAVDLDDAPPSWRKAEAVMTNALQLLKRGDYEKVIADLTPADEPLREPKALMMRAVAQMGLRRHEAALADLDAAERSVWSYLGAIDVNRAHVHNRQGRHGEARLAAERAVKRMPSDAWVARVSLASSCELDGDGEAAERTMREMAAALADAKKKQREEAASYVERMADLDTLRQRVDIRALLQC